MFHLEYLPTHFGEQYAKGLLSAGIPPAAMNFIATDGGDQIELLNTNPGVVLNRSSGDAWPCGSITKVEIEDFMSGKGGTHQPLVSVSRRGS